jgi:hypothetical protein
MTSLFRYLQTNDLVTFKGLIHQVKTPEHRDVDATLFCGYSVMRPATPEAVTESYRQRFGAVLVQAPNQTCLECARREGLNASND